MRLMTTAALSVLLAGSLSLPASGIDRSPARYKTHLPGTDLVRADKHSSLPAFIRFEKGKEIAFSEWQQWVSENLSLNKLNGFRLLKTDRDQLGDVHYRYQQSYNGLSYEHAIWIVHTRAGKVYSMNGLLYGNATPPATTVNLTEAAALNKALAYVNAETYKWQLPSEEEHLKKESKNNQATYYPHGQLFYIAQGNDHQEKNLHLCWKFNVYAHKPLSRAEIFVDAVTGEIIHRNQILHDADVTGTAITAYSGTQTITTDNFAGGYRLRETGRGNGINTYNMQTGTNYGSAVDFTDADNTWNNVNPQMDEVATDAHWGAEKTYDYYQIKHGRNSIDGAGFELNSYVHYDAGFANAFWDGDRMTYGDGDGAMNPLTAIDIAGHEITHGLTTFSANLAYADESGALNESFSDIFGVAIEWYANPSAGDWLMGEDIGVVIRSMSNPGAYGDPDTYFGTNWAPLGGPDNGGVHTNSGVQNFWFYLMVNGGTGTNDNGDAYNVSALGFTDAEAIAFRNLTVYLTPSSDYSDARFYAIQSAIDLFGPCTPEVASTTNAWYAVGVGPAYVAAVVSDFEAATNMSCSAPFTVDFTNASINASTFSWNFGDGGTSTLNNPSHTYTALGTYTVQLIADGGSCGKDTLVLTNYITIDTSIACEVSLPVSGTAATQTSCAGTLFDSGGPTGDYGPGENAQITISPLGALTVDLDFTSFDVEPGTGTSCNYDNIVIYDGPSTASPVIGTYCNNNIPTTISSTGGSITIKFHSDGGLELPGFAMNWSCNLSSVAPDAGFTSDVTTTCNGRVQFTDLTANGPSGWSWDFGDGGTSTVQNPLHYYTTDGLYTVKLVVTNSIGEDSLVQVDMIEVDMPDAPTGVTGPGTTICANTSTTLTAAATGTLTWYNVPVGGAPLGTGSPFVTPLLTTSTTFYVANEVPNPSAYVGPVDNTFGSGGSFVGDQHLVFTCSTPVVLKSVRVYANGGGNRTIELRDASGTVIQSATINIPNGSSRINLNFNVPVGTGLQLGCLDGSAPNLYRNSTGAAYPYTLPGVISITGSSAGSLDYYYFFYDWEVQEPGCSSARVPVSVAVQPCMGMTEVASTLGVEVVPNPATEQVKIIVKGSDGKNVGIEIRNSIGQVVWSESKTLDGTPVLVNVGHFGRGVYLVNMVMENERIVKKLVVE